MGEPTLKQVFSAIEQQILVGKTYLSIAKGLLQAEPGVLGVAPTFFGRTVDGCLELAQMAVARLYDKPRGSVTIRTMLRQSDREVSSFQKGDCQQVREAIAKSQSAVQELEPVLTAIAHRRNEWLAHLDPETVRNPQALAQKARLTTQDLDQAFGETEKILAGLRRLFDGTFGPIRYSGDGDYKDLLDHVRRSQGAAKKEFDAKFEAQFGHPPPRL